MILNNLDHDQLIAHADSLSGRVAVVYYNRPVKIKKTGNLVGKTVEKHSIFKVRVGLEYNNQKAVIEKHESGEVEKKGLPASMTKLSRVHYEHKFNGNDYIGCTPNKASTDKTETTWLVDGEKVELEDIKDDILKSEWNSNSQNSDWLFLKTDHIVGLSGME